jgi:hypothetical protein
MLNLPSEKTSLFALVQAVKSYIGKEFRFSLDVPSGVLVIRREDIKVTSKTARMGSGVLTEVSDPRKQLCL